MKKEKISAILNDIDARYIAEAADPKSAPKRSVVRLRWSIAAACLLLAAGLTGAAFAVEAGQYQSAVAFFEENGLSTEGLSRAEVKAVYRDITLEHFNLEKTADVIRQTVPGMQIEQESPSPAELAALWDHNLSARSLPKNRVSYRVDTQYGKKERFEKSILTCYQGETALWTAEFTDFYIEESVYLDGLTAVWGRNEVYSSEETSYAWLACVDDAGQILWQRCLLHGFGQEYIAAVLDDGDGTWAVISRGDLEYLCLSRYDRDGNEQHFRKTSIGNLGIRNAARLGDGYIVQVGGWQMEDTAVLYRLDREGDLLDSITYQGENCDYYITDMVEFGGQIYLSAYAVPEQTDAGGRHEIANILAYIFEQEAWEIPEAELTEIVRKNYTAVLLLCDPEGGAPKTFYSVQGSLGGALSVHAEEQLEWDVESITSTFFSPATSAFSIGGSCRVFRYTFDADGRLLDQTDTGETVPYHR